jgi:hypothetical protein
VAKLTILQTNFTGGEISPKMMGRSEVTRYNAGAETMENVKVAVQGGADRRGGFGYCAIAKHGGSRLARLVPYVASEALSYVVELGHLYARFFYNDGSIVLDSTGLAVLELESPYTEDQIFQVTARQGEDTLLLFHPDVPTQRIQRLSATLWSLVPVPWVVEPVAEIGFNPDAVLTISDGTIGAGRTFTSADVTVPGAPTAVAATPLDGAARVTFTPPANNGGVPVLSYTATSSPGGITATGSASGITVPGLTNGVAYTFTVVATNAVGDSAASAASGAVTPLAGLATTSVDLALDMTDVVLDLEGGLQSGLGGPTGTASNGTPPYAYAWTKLGGSSSLIALTTADAAALIFSSSGRLTTNYAGVRCTVTDAAGNTATADANLTVTHQGFRRDPIEEPF